MKFSENLVKLRKEQGWSQEQLAERLEVTRQTIYKWESGQSYPEMDRLMMLSELFHCTIDDLIKVGINTDTLQKKKEYDAFYNKYAKSTAIGVGLILLGVSMMFLLFGLFGEVSYLFPVMALLLFVLVAVALFIYYGTQEEEFKKNIPADANYYDSSEKREFSKKMGLAMTISVSLIFIGIILFVSLVEFAFENPFYPLALLMLIIAVAVYMMVYYGMLSDKLKMEPKPKKQSAIVEKLNSVIMMIATVVFLLLGFLQGAWHPAWVAFPIGGILCGIVSVVFQKEESI